MAKKLTLVQVRAKKAKEVSNLIAIKTAERAIAAMDSPLYIPREIAKRNEAQLASITAELEAFGKDNCAIRKQFGFGNQVDAILTILTSVMYCKGVVKDEALAISMLDTDIIEQTLEALGSTTYFNEKTCEIVPHRQHNAPYLKQLIEAIADDMGIVDVQLSKISTTNMDLREKIAFAKASKLNQNLIDNPVGATVEYAA
jgi:hypothetical protein